MLTLSIDAGLATVVLDRPPVNAWDDKGVDQLEEMTGTLLAAVGVQLVVVRSAHRHFSAGGDIAMMAAAIERGDVTPLDRFAARIQQAFAAWAALPMPTLAVLRGAVTGGGLELALACDLRIAAHEARIGLPEARLGLVPAGGGTQRLTAAIGRGGALRLMLTGELVDGREARELGVVEWSVPDAELDEHADEVAARILAMPPAALRAVKRCVALAGMPEGYVTEAQSQRLLHAHPETQQRLRDFLHDNRRKNGN